MVREDLVGALQSALSRGYPLKLAMQSLLNAGYSKIEIEEAARNLNNMQPANQVSSPINQTISVVKPGDKKTIQRISDYGEKPKVQASNIIIYILGGILVLLLVGLVLVFLFKEQVVDFIKGLFGQ